MTNGTLYIKAERIPGQKLASYVAILQNGQLTYVGYEIPNEEKFIKSIDKVVNPKRIDFALKFFIKQAQNQLSVRSLLEQLVRIRLLNWEQSESFVHKQTLPILEQLLYYSGTIRYDPNVNFDLSYGKDGHGLNGLQLIEELSDRQQQWDNLDPTIPSMNAVPELAEGALGKIIGQDLRRQLID